VPPGEQAMWRGQVVVSLQSETFRIGTGSSENKKVNLKGQCHEMVVEFRPWVTSKGLN
jgi:hypothetical protein